MISSPFAVFENSNLSSRRLDPFIVDMQSDLLADVLATRLFAPLATVAFIKRPIAELTPVVTFRGSDYVVDIPQMAPVIGKTLGSPIGSLAAYRNDLIRAVDRLITGN
jgi:toxin CcdB